MFFYWFNIVNGINVRYFTFGVIFHDAFWSDVNPLKIRV